jgi:hypothetical protein
MKFFEKIDFLLKDYEPGHSEYQIKNFIIGSEIHCWHRYKQCLREIAGRKETLENSRQMIFLAQKQIENLSRSIFKTKKRNLKIKELQIQKIRNQKTANSCLNELIHFVKAAFEIRKKYGFENLNYEKKQILEADAWREKAKFMLFMDLFCIGRPSKQTMEFVYKLPKAIKRELLTQIDPRDQQKIKEYLIG